MSNYALLTTLSGWPRRVAAVLCLLAAGLTAVSAGGSRSAETQVVVASHAMAAGHALQPSDLRQAVWPASSVPSSAARSPADVVGRRMATAVSSGMPISPEGLMEPAMAHALAAGQLATTVSLVNADELSILHAGSYVDLYVVSTEPISIDGKPVTSRPAPAPAATGVLVLSVLTGTGDDGHGSNPTLVIAAGRSAVAALSSHAGATFLATLVAPP